MVAKNKRFKEEFAKFFEEPSREALRDLLQSQVGELDSIDFKKTWPAWPKVARHILGQANSRGGCIIIGVNEKDDNTFEPVGLEVLQDKADIQKSLKKYLPAQLKYEILDFVYEDSEYPKLVGKKFQVVIVEDETQYVPFVAKIDGDGIRENAIYIRRGTNTEEANYEELQEIINRRIETGYSSKGEFDINKHLAELKALYEHVDLYYDPFPDYIDLQRPDHYEPNPNYPEEFFEGFVVRMLEEKKKLIEKMLLIQ